MRILQVTRQYHPRIGGIETVTKDLCYWLKTRGHSVEVVTLDHDLASGAQFSSYEILDDIPVHRLRYFGPSSYSLAFGLLPYLRKFDLIHIHGIDFFVDFTALTHQLRLHHTPFVVNTHGGIFHTTRFGYLKRLYCTTISRFSLSVCDAVICDSDSDRALFADFVPAEKLSVIGNGVDIETYYNANETRRNMAIAVGRLTKAKNFDQVIRLWATVADKIPGAELVIVGRDEDGFLQSLINLAAELGIGGQVKLVGQLPQADFARLLSQARLFISASRHEGFGISTVEALAAGIPILVTPTGIHTTIVNEGVNGWLWSGQPDQRSSEILLRAMRITGSEMAPMQSAARASASPYCWSRVILQYETLFQRVCRQSAS
jgi:alpha-1,3-mannosyltransferase